MKRKSKSAIIRSLLLAALPALLSACGSINWPHVYGPDEIPESVREADRPIPSAGPSPEGTPFPLVGTVPSHPKDFTPQPTIDLSKELMEDGPG